MMFGTQLKTWVGNLVRRTNRKTRRQRPATRRPLVAEQLEARDVPASFTWTPTVAGAYNWNDPTNWTETGGGSGFPDAQGDVANLIGALSGNQTISLNQAITVGTLNLGSTGPGAFTLVGGTSGTITFDAGAGSAILNDGANGGDALNTPINLNGNLTFSSNGVAPLAFGGGITGTGAVTTSGTIALTTGSFTTNGVVTSTSGLDVGPNVTLGGTGTFAPTPVIFVESYSFPGSATNKSALYEFNANTGTLLATLIAPNSNTLLDGPAGMTTGPDGNLYISSQNNDSILKYDLNTHTLSTFIDSATMNGVAAALTASNPYGPLTQFAPAGLAFGPDGNLYVSMNGGYQDVVPNGGVVRFNISGGAYAGTNSPVATFLTQPTALTFGTAVGDTSTLYVSSQSFSFSTFQFTGMVDKVTGATTGAPAQSTFIGNAGEFAAGLNWGPDGKLYVVDLGANDGVAGINRFDANGNSLGAFVNSGTVAFQFPSFSVFTPDGRLLVADLGPTGGQAPNPFDGSVAQYDSATGNFLGTLVSSSQFPSIGPASGDKGLIASQLLYRASAAVVVNGTLNPGGASGTLSAGDVAFGTGSSFTATLDGTTGSQIDSTGIVNLNGTTLNLSVGAAPPPGTAFTLVTASSVVGTFATHPDNSIVTAGGLEFTIHYTGTDVVLTRVQAPIFTSSDSTSFFVQKNNTFNVTASGFPAITYTTTSTLPSGVTLASDGTLSGTPDISSAGVNYPITIVADNGIDGPVSQNFTLVVNPSSAPTISSINHATFTRGSFGTYTVIATGSPTATLSKTAGSLPTGVSFHDNGNGTATLSGSPTGNVGGTYNFTIDASNGIGTDATQSFTLTVNQTSAITSLNNATFTVGTFKSVTITSTGFPNPTLSQPTTLPSGVTFVDNGNGTATLSGTATGNVGGVYNFTITASNGIGASATQPFTLTVDQAPSIVGSSAATFTTGVFGTFTFTTTGFPQATLSQPTTLPSGVSFVDNGNGTATLSGTPSANTGGSYSFTITAANGIGSNATLPFTLTVDQAPAYTSTNSQVFLTGAFTTFTVTTSGYPIANVSKVGTLPPGMSFVANPDGTTTISGTPTSDGDFTLALTASNGVSPDAPQSLTLHVRTSPSITSANAATFSLLSKGTFQVAANGSDTLTITESGKLPDGVTLSSTGVLTGTPAAGTAGTYPIVVTAHNGFGPDFPQNFTLTVKNPTGLDSELSVGGSLNGTTTVYDPASGQFNTTPSTIPSPFGNISVSVRSTSGDVDGDGIPDTIVVTGPGTAIQVAVISGKDGSVLVKPFDPFGGSFSGGGFVAAADLNGDGKAEFIVTPDQGGGPRVAVFSMGTGGHANQLASFFGIDDPNFRGGARAALGDVNHDGTPDLAVAAGIEGGPRVALFDGSTLLTTRTKLVNDFFAYPDGVNSLRNGVFVAIGDVNGDGYGDLIFGSGPGGGPRVEVISGQTLLTSGAVAAVGAPLANFFVGGTDSDRGGVRVATADVDGDGLADVIVGSGDGQPSDIKLYLGKDFAGGTGEPKAQDLDPFNSAILTDGIFVS